MFVSLRNVGEINSTVLQSENLSSITRFESKNSGITGIAENAFSSLSNLKVLILDGNRLSNISQNWFRNPAAISELALSFNRMEDLNESSLKGLTNLKKLKLNGNRIQTIHPDSFSSQSMLTDLDLSENRLMRLSPHIFSSLKSLMFIRLYGNPWNCSCDAQDFVESLKEMNTSLLVDLMSVTCETPPHLKGLPVINVSVCSTPPPPGTPSRNRTTLTTNTPTTRPMQPSAKTKTPFQPKPTDPPGTTSAHTGHYVTSSSSAIYPTSTKRPVTTPTGGAGPTTTSNTNVCTLIAVIAVLCLLLLVVCFVAVMHRRNHSNKAVRPGCPTEEVRHEGDRISGQDQSRSGCSGHRSPEEAWRRSFTGIRAKSANAIILSSPFCVSEKDKVTSQTEIEVPSENSRKEDLVSETGAEMGEGLHLETFTTIDSVEECVRQEGDTGSLYKNQECAHVNTDVIPYLSIGTKQNKPSPDKDSAESAAQCSQRGKFMRRISTWPPTASQWQARCKRKEEEGEEVDEFAVWSVTMELSEDVKIMMDYLSSSNRCEKEKETDLNLRLSDSFKPPESPVSVLEEEGMILDPYSVKQARIQVSPNEELKSEKHPAPKNISRADVRKDQKRSVTIRQRAENRAAPGSKAPSGGASPDDETLLSGNEYAFMDLLHEVVQNNGRWTRERWKQIHLNKQRR
ncbi:hypothetical protein CRENBAI_009584 [Crenichthys baileyi]|uniref:LRRCT domain-containing protein n=1 Tax=Crenichthys baileyi TaxID=28760 RepID=A0AAV9RKC6_9TELE